MAVKVYDQYCENDSVKGGTSFNAGLDAVIKAIPIKFSLGSGSTEERTKFFCKTFDSDYKRNEQYYRSTSQVVNQTTNAWLACKALASQGVVFRPQVSKTQVLIEIARTKPDPVTVQGIQYNKQLATCYQPPDANEHKKSLVADKDTVKELGSGSWTITCQRTPESAQKELVYPAFDISVGTTKGPFLIPVAADAKFPYQWASELQQQVTLVENLAKSNNESLQRIGVQSGRIKIAANGTRALTDDSKCPNSVDGFRGEHNGRVSFSSPFESIPVVSLALHSIDIIDQTASSPSNRLHVSVTSVDKTGFNYQFYTWCTTKVYDADASWIAVAK